jgi:hypothetical protein
MSNLAIATPEQQAALAKVTGSKADALVVRSACEIAASPLPDWLVKGVLPRHGVAALYGPPGCGKSFLGLDLSFAVASGRDWFDARATACPVLYVAAEAGNSMGPRILAHFARMPDEDDAPVYFIPQAVDLFRGLDLRPLITAVKQVDAKLVIIDTLARTTAGADENAPGDMGQIVGNLAELAREADALVLVIHHSGKDVAKGPRGHTALIAAVDVAIEVSRDASGGRSWKLHKSRDGQDGIEHLFRLRPVVVAEDSEGDSVTSCCVEIDGNPQAPRKTVFPSGKNERAVADIIGEVLKTSRRFGEAGAPTGRPVADLEAVIEAAQGRLAVEPKRHRERVLSAVQGLLSKGCLCMRSNLVWLP